MKLLRWFVIAVALMELFAPSRACLLAQTAVPDEFQVRAAIIMNLVRFVTWPPSRDNPHGPVMVGLLGYDEQSAALERYLNGHAVDGRSFQIKRLGRSDRVEDCQMVYVATSERRRFEELSAALSAAAVLTISDDASFASGAGMVGLPVIGDHVEIQINLAQAEHSKLAISSRLLSLAKVTRKGAVR